MNRIAKVLGRIIAVLVNAGLIDREQAVWILEPLKEQTETEADNGNDKQRKVY